MAKGDPEDARAQTRQARSTYAPQLQQYTNSLYPQQQVNWNNAQAAGAMNVNDYGQGMNAYRMFANNPGINYNRSGEMNSAMGGYQNFANTGGFSDQDMQDMRARAVSPIRAQYQTAMSELSRNRNLSSGYSPNYNAALAKMTREQSYNTADAMTNVNAQLAQMVQQGKLAGLSGLGNLSSQDAQLALSALTGNANARLGAMSGMNSLYGATPGLTNMFGQQVSQANNDLARSLGLSTDFESNLLRNQANLANAPGSTDVAMGRIGEGVGMVSGFIPGASGGKK